jgi:hypothetical protein
MKLSRPKTEKYHNYEEGDCGSPIDRHGKHLSYFKRVFGKNMIVKDGLETCLRN